MKILSISQQSDESNVQDKNDIQHGTWTKLGAEQ
jgi:hypothetical protein